MTPAGIEPATFRFVAQHLNHCATTQWLRDSIPDRTAHSQSLYRLSYPAHYNLLLITINYETNAINKLKLIDINFFLINLIYVYVNYVSDIDLSTPVMFPILSYRFKLCSRYCLIDLKYVPDNLTDTSCVTDIVLIGYVPVVVLSISIMFPTFLLISVMYLILSYRFKLCSRYSY